ncbi:MAG TPA: flagellar basal-body rod protein FlgG [Caulobacteraceae bacterium]|jgi:flagellar basal-body rod protein FlgG|nr:flagellar basal-body rod protein FlgG [Caulobacteraceae bacterium]
MLALRTAATGMAAQQMNVEVISNNIANMNTIGYKKQRAEFEDLLYQNVERAGVSSSAGGTIVPTGVQIGSGVKAGSVYRITQQGALTQTGNKLDIAIDGKGFFPVLMPSGETAYTRAGNFSVSPTGTLVTADGYTVQPAITIPQGATDVSISADGQVQATIAGQTAPSVVGQMQLANFFNEGGLEAIGNNLMLESSASGPAQLGTATSTGFGSLRQGYTEASNVDAVGEVTALIVAQRAYEMNSKVVTAADQMLATASQLKS